MKIGGLNPRMSVAKLDLKHLTCKAGSNTLSQSQYSEFEREQHVGVVALSLCKGQCLDVDSQYFLSRKGECLQQVFPGFTKRDRGRRQCQQDHS